MTITYNILDKFYLHHTLFFLRIPFFSVRYWKLTTGLGDGVNLGGF